MHFIFELQHNTFCCRINKWFWCLVTHTTTISYEVRELNILTVYFFWFLLVKAFSSALAIFFKTTIIWSDIRLVTVAGRDWKKQTTNAPNTDIIQGRQKHQSLVVCVRQWHLAEITCTETVCIREINRRIL